MAGTSFNVSLPDTLKDYVQERVDAGHYGTASDFVGDLIRADMRRRGRERLERLLLEGLASGEAEDVTEETLSQMEREAEAIIAASLKSAG